MGLLPLPRAAHAKPTRLGGPWPSPPYALPPPRSSRLTEQREGNRDRGAGEIVLDTRASPTQPHGVRVIEKFDGRSKTGEKNGGFRRGIYGESVAATMPSETHRTTDPSREEISRTNEIPVRIQISNPTIKDNALRALETFQHLINNPFTPHKLVRMEIFLERETYYSIGTSEERNELFATRHDLFYRKH